MAKKSKAVQRAETVRRTTTNTAETTTRRATRRPEAVKARKDARRQEAARRERQWFYTKVGMAVVAAAIVAGLGWFGYGRYQEYRMTKDVTSYFSATDFVATHTNEKVLYEEVPPVGGYHNSVWQNCGFYAKYIENEHGVHALEHGAVWITYDPNLPEDQINTLKSKTDQQYVLVSPYPGMDAPVVASVWGKQIKLDSADDWRLDAFIRKYKQNPKNTPETGAVCWGGLSATTDVEPQQQPYVRTSGTSPVGGIPISEATATAAAANPVTPTVPAGTPPAAGSPPATAPKSTPESATPPA